MKKYIIALMLLCSTAKAERTVMEGHPSTNSSITVSSTTADVKFGGTIEVTSSATASAFFGDGSHLSGINGTVGISSSCAAGYFLSTGTWVNGVLTGGGCMPAAEPASCTLPQVLTGTTATGFTCQEPSNVTGNAGGTASNVTGTVAVANGGTSATTSAAAAANLVNGNPISPSAVYAVSGANVSTMTPTGMQTGAGKIGNTTLTPGPGEIVFPYSSYGGQISFEGSVAGNRWASVNDNNNYINLFGQNGIIMASGSGEVLRAFGNAVGIDTINLAATLTVNGNFSWGTGVNISTGNADGSLVTASSVTINTGNADGTGAKLVLSNWPGVAGWAQFNMAGVGAGGLAINTPVDFNGNFAGNNGSFSWYNDKATFGNNPVEISSGTLIVDGAGAVAAIGSAPAPGAVLTAAGMIQASSATFTAGVYTTTLNATSNATIATVNSKYYRDSTNVYNLASRATTEWQLGGGYQLMLTDGGAVAISSASPVGYAFSVGATTGSAVDVNGHNLSFGPAPVLSSCGTSPSIHGTDRIGAITLGTAATGCVMTFVAPYPTGSQVSCTATTNSTTIPAALTSASTSAVTFSLSAAITGGVIYYNCGAAL